MSKSQDIRDTRDFIMERDGYKCQHEGCNVRGYDNLQMAHLIAKSKSSCYYVINFWYQNFNESITKKKAMAILNRPENLTASCPDHNSYFNRAGNMMEVINILNRIKKEMDNEAK